MDALNYERCVAPEAANTPKKVKLRSLPFHGGKDDTNEWRFRIVGEEDFPAASFTTTLLHLSPGAHRAVPQLNIPTTHNLDFVPLFSFLLLSNLPENLHVRKQISTSQNSCLAL